MSPSQQSIPTTNSSPPTLFPTTCTTQGMGSPFTAHSPSGLPTPLQGFQHRLDKKSLCWDLRNSTVATGIHTTTKHLLLLTIFETKYCSQAHNLSSHEITAPNNYHTCPLWLPSSFNTQNSLCCPKNPCKNCSACKNMNV
jgi:hypothetical protein